MNPENYFSNNSHSDVFVAVKKTIPITAEKALSDGVVQTLEGPVQYQAGAYIVTGVKGEKYPVEAHKFEAAYNKTDKNTYVKKPLSVLVCVLHDTIQVKVGWQKDPLVGKTGDFLAKYGPGDFGIIARDIFLETYDIKQKMAILDTKDKAFDLSR